MLSIIVNNISLRLAIFGLVCWFKRRKGRKNAKTEIAESPQHVEGVKFIYSRSPLFSGTKMLSTKQRIKAQKPHKSYDIKASSGIGGDENFVWHREL
jgi:hypothetical protein